MKGLESLELSGPGWKDLRPLNGHPSLVRVR